MVCVTPEKTVQEAMESHRGTTRGQSVADKYEQALEYAPSELHDKLSSGVEHFPFERDDYVAIDRGNFDKRISEGGIVIVSFGKRPATGHIVAEILNCGDIPNDECKFRACGVEFSAYGWQIRSVLPDGLPSKD